MSDYMATVALQISRAKCWAAQRVLGDHDTNVISLSSVSSTLVIWSTLLSSDGDLPLGWFWWQDSLPGWRTSLCRAWFVFAWAPQKQARVIPLPNEPRWDPPVWTHVNTMWATQKYGSCASGVKITWVSQEPCTRGIKFSWDHPCVVGCSFWWILVSLNPDSNEN